MLKKMKVHRKREPELIEIDVEFPIYREHDLMSDHHDECVHYNRWEGPGEAEFEILETIEFNGDTSYEIGTVRSENLHPNNGEDYMTGKGKYASSKERFYAAVARARAALDAIPTE